MGQVFSQIQPANGRVYNFNMKCPKCDQDMEVREMIITSNQKEGEAYKEYNRILYLSKTDDIWITTEIPK